MRFNFPISSKYSWPISYIVFILYSISFVMKYSVCFSEGILKFIPLPVYIEIHEDEKSTKKLDYVE